VNVRALEPRRSTDSDSAWVFDGVPEGDVREMLSRLEQRVYGDGSVIIAEGEHPGAMFIIAEGHADVLMTGADGREHSLNRVGPGATLGEMSALTGTPASATVRAVGDLHAWVMNQAELQRAAARFPRMYHNLGATLALKLAHADRRAIGVRGRGTTTVLLVDGGPAELGRALAASVAWHSRRPTILVVLDSQAEPARHETAGLHVTIARPVGAFAPSHLPRTIDDLHRRYTNVLVQTARPLPAVVARSIRLVGADEASGDCTAGGSTLRGWSECGTGGNRIGPDRRGVVNVPRLRPADELALSEGWLTTSTPAGARLGWLARDLTGLKVGLALGGGGLKGYAHLGVLRVFERLGMPLDFLAGTSIGGVVASLYALDHGPDAIADILDAAAGALVRPVLSTRSLLSDDHLRRYLRAQGERVRFEDLRVPLALVAADIVSGNEVVFKRGLVWPAALATIAIPGLFPAQAIGPYHLVDGGILNPVPADVVADMGADAVIAVRLRSELPGSRYEAEGAAPSGPPPSVVEVLTRSLDLMQARLAPRAEAATTVLVEPRCEGAPGMGLRRFNEGRRYIQAGAAAAEAAVPRLQSVFPWLSGPL
jgi:NTE family protein